MQGKELQLEELQICQICGEEVGVTAEGEVFVACNECALPICRTCYDYERKEGTQLCPHCKTRFRRLKGCPRVHGDDEDEDDIDEDDHDLHNESNFQDMPHQGILALQLHHDHIQGTYLHNCLYNFTTFASESF